MNRIYIFSGFTLVPFRSCYGTLDSWSWKYWEVMRCMFQVNNTEYKSSVNLGTVVFQELLVNQIGESQISTTLFCGVVNDSLVSSL